MTKLEKLINTYLDKNPKAQNPVEYLGLFGYDRMVEILEEAKGKLITFSLDSTKIDCAKYEISA